MHKGLRKQKKNPLYLYRPMASKLQVKTFQFGRLHAHFIPRFLVTVQGGRYPGATERSYLTSQKHCSETRFESTLGLTSVIGFLSSLPLNILSVGEWWQWK